MELKIGLDTIANYKRLAYTPWHALAEFVDNSTQSYFNNKTELDKAFAETKDRLQVSIVYDRDAGLVRIWDNSIGMTLQELEHALYVGKPPVVADGRSRYGLGLKTASCWLGNVWTVKTKKLGHSKEYTVTIDVDQVAQGNSTLSPREIEMDAAQHHTIIEITKLNRSFAGRTSGKIRSFLGSMYRVDFRNKRLELRWQDEVLDWQQIDNRILEDKEKNKFKKEFRFQVQGKNVHGWVAVLESGSRADAGFSIIQAERVIKGWPDSWRPSKLYGQDQGSNDLINQRLFGEIHLDGFTVSHTKDSILWFGDEEEEVESKLAVACADYREEAKRFRKGDKKSGPSPVATATAIDELTKEMQSPEMVDEISLIEIPSEEAVNKSLGDIISKVKATNQPSFRISIGSLTVTEYLSNDLSPNDPYVLLEATAPTNVIVIINESHPHWNQLKDVEVLNYFRHCTYDAVAEWQARTKAGSINPNTIKTLKDKLLRVTYLREENSTNAG